MTEEVLRTILAERGAITAERFIELMATAVATWEAEANGKADQYERRGYARGFHGGQGFAYRNMASLLELSPLVKEDGTPPEAPLSSAIADA
jgi:hypothetical protein